MSFIAVALIASLALALASGPLGCFIVWRRMAYFGDTLAHASLLGVGAGLLLQVSVPLSILACCLLCVPLIAMLTRHNALASDAALGILSHGSLAIGLVAVSLSQAGSLELSSYLFGDVLAISKPQMWTLLATVCLILTVLGFHWRDLVFLTIHRELAAIEGKPVARLQLTLLLLTALLVAIGMQLVGVLLITALLITPAATAGLWAKSPESMAASATLLAVLSVLGGLTLSWFYDTPAGPSMVVAATALFALLRLLLLRK